MKARGKKLRSHYRGVFFCVLEDMVDERVGSLLSDFVRDFPKAVFPLSFYKRNWENCIVSADENKGCLFRAVVIQWAKYRGDCARLNGDGNY